MILFTIFEDKKLMLINLKNLLIIFFKKIFKIESKYNKYF